MAGGHRGEWGRVTAGELREEGARRLIAIKREQKMEGEARGAEQARSELRQRATGRSRGRKVGGRKEREVPTGGTGLSATQEKKKRRAGEAGHCGRRKLGRWAGWAEKKVRFLFFFSFFFSNSIKTNF
jgi:hypothetical protein